MTETRVSLPILGEVDVDAIYRNPNTRLVKPTRSGKKPLYGKAMKDVCAVMDEKSIEIARRLGNGNLSAGIRAALEGK